MAAAGFDREEWLVVWAAIAGVGLAVAAVDVREGTIASNGDGGEDSGLRKGREAGKLFDGWRKKKPTTTELL